MPLNSRLNYQTELFSPTGDFQQVEPKLSLNRTLDCSDRCTEDDRVEFGNHGSGTKLAQTTAALTGWAAGVFFGQVGKVGSAFNLSLQVLTGFFR